MRIIDIHSHCLPMTDDGAKSNEQAMNMLRIAAQEGFTDMVLTPHFRPSGNTAPSGQLLEEKVKKLQQEADTQGIGIRLYIGNEIYYCSELPRLLEEKNVHTLAGSRYVLVEFSPMEEYSYIKNGLYQILSAGYLPVLAHVERYQAFLTKKDRVEDCLEMGAYIQMNFASAAGAAGRETKKFCKRLLKEKLVHFLATDAHSDGARAPRIGKDVTKMLLRIDTDYYEKLLSENPGKILLNQRIK